MNYEQNGLQGRTYTMDDIEYFGVFLISLVLSTRLK